MRNYLLLFALLGACSGKKDPGGTPGNPGTGAAVAGLGTPKPGFEGEGPKGALKIDDMEVGKYGGSLVIATAGDPKSFNPILANETSTTEILYGPVFNTCWKFHNVKQEGGPGLCEKFERTEDGLTYTFTLREGLKWSDGQPMTADDFEFSYKVLVDPTTAATVKDLFRQGKDANGQDRFAIFEKVDPRTFRFKLHQMDVLFEYAVGSIYVTPKHKWETAFREGKFNNSLTLQTPPEDIVSSGPFRIKSFASAERVVLERNPHYWKVDAQGNRLPYLDRVIFTIVPDFNVAFLKFRDGESDVHEVRPEEIDLLKREQATSNYQLLDLGPSFNSYYLMFNLDTRSGKDGKPFVDPIKAKWFNDKNFRKAVSFAIDREGIIRTVFSGHGVPLWSFYSPANKKWHPSKVEQYPFSLEKAGELLTASGFVRREGVLYDAAGNKVEFTVVTNSENALRIQLLTVVKDDLKKLGIEVNVRPVPFNDLVSSLNDTRNFDAIVLGWATAVPPDPAMSKNVMLSSGRSHGWNPNQPQPATEWEKRIDELLYKNISEFDYEKRKQYSDELQYIFSDELPQIMIVVYSAYAAARTNVGNFKPSAIRPVTHWNIEEMFLRTPKP